MHKYHDPLNGLQCVHRSRPYRSMRREVGSRSERVAIPILRRADSSFCIDSLDSRPTVSTYDSSSTTLGFDQSSDARDRSEVLGSKFLVVDVYAELLFHERNDTKDPQRIDDASLDEWQVIGQAILRLMGRDLPHDEITQTVLCAHFHLLFVGQRLREKRSPIDLASRSLGKRHPKFELFRDHVAWDSFRAELDELPFRARVTNSDKCLDPVRDEVIRDCDHGTVGDRWMRKQGSLDFSELDPIPSALDLRVTSPK